MVSEELLEAIKRSEDAGFKSEGLPYVDTEGHNTIGYGTKLPLLEKECELLLRHRLETTVSVIDVIFCTLKIKQDAWDVLYEMGYQMGIAGLTGFKKMLIALKDKDYTLAAVEMRDSKWYTQTTNRAERLAVKMEGI